MPTPHAVDDQPAMTDPLAGILPAGGDTVHPETRRSRGWMASGATPC